MWLKAHLTMRLRGRAEVAGGYKAVLELASSIASELGKENENPLNLTEQQLQQSINRLDCGTISYKSAITQSSYSFRKGLSKLPKSEKCWLSAVCLSCLCLSLIWMVNFPFFFFMTFFLFSIGFAVIVGRTNKSRMFLTLCGCVPGIIVAVYFAPALSGVNITG